MFDASRSISVHFEIDLPTDARETIRKKTNSHLKKTTPAY
jgi:hypothetical protein